MLCVFLRGVEIVGVTPTQDVKVDLQGHDSRTKRNAIGTPSQNKTSDTQSIIGARQSMNTGDLGLEVDVLWGFQSLTQDGSGNGVRQASFTVLLSAVAISSNPPYFTFSYHLATS